MIMIIDSVVIHDDSDCYVIAEIGHNHQGNLEMAKECSASESQAAGVRHPYSVFTGANA